MIACIGCGEQAYPDDVAWGTVDLRVGDLCDTVALCGACQRLLHLSDQGLLVGAKTAIHLRFRMRVGDAMIREEVERSCHAALVSFRSRLPEFQ